MTLSTDIIQYLTDQSIVGGVTGWDAEENFMPDSPSKMIYVEDIDGIEPELTKSSGDLLKPQVSIFARGEPVDDAGYADTKSKMEAILLALRKVPNITINGNDYMLIYAIKNIANKGRDLFTDGGRQVFSIVVTALLWEDVS